MPKCGQVNSTNRSGVVCATMMRTLCVFGVRFLVLCGTQNNVNFKNGQQSYCVNREKQEVVFTRHRRWRFTLYFVSIHRSLAFTSLLTDKGSTNASVFAIRLGCFRFSFYPFLFWITFVSVRVLFNYVNLAFDH